MTNEKEMPHIGQKAPDFTLKDQHGQDFTLHSAEGKKVLLSFHPLAWTKVCAQQMQSLHDNSKKFDELNTIPLGMSVDTAPSKKAWAESLGITDIRMLCDFWPHGEVAKLYGIFREKNGISERANILIDGDGIITFFKVYEMSELPDITKVLDAIGLK
jgi:peroxiredoxin